ncbi:MAG: SDR family NAD(P)-dependent oxidoreductase [Alphaproteobacteria bacterium]
MAEAKLINVLKMFRLDGDTALITGAGNGIGRTAALALAEAGAAIAVTDIEGDSAEKVADEITAQGGKARAYVLDVSDADAIVANVDQVVADFGRLDVLVNNAGVVVPEPTVDVTMESWDRTIAINMTACFVASREAGRHMLKAKRGRIISVASVMGFSGGGIYGNLAYRASKGAVVNMTRALAAEWALDGIRVNAIAPGWVNTRLVEVLRGDPEIIPQLKARIPMGRFADPEEMAPAILFLASEASSMVTGHTLPVDGGYLAI